MRRCRVKGDYDYAAVSKKDAVVKMKDTASLEANFSGSAAQVPVDAAAEIQAGRALHLAYSVVGVESTNLLQVFEGQLEGECGGATHFVFGAARGAFAMRTGARADSYTAAQVFEFAGVGASTSAEKDTATSDGKLAACEGANADDQASVPGCEALIRIELAPLESGGGPTPGQSTPMTGRPDLRGCPEGFILAGDACVERTEGLKSTHLCDPTDFADCAARCEAGSAGSCDRLGRIIGGQPGGPGGAVEAWRAFDTTANRSKVAAWIPALEAACAQGEGGACYAGSIAILRREWSGGANVTGDEMAWYNERGCEVGEPHSCYALVPRTSNPSTEQLKRWRAIGERSCRSGSPVACMYYGWGLGGVWKAPITNTAGAVTALDQSCDGGVWESCFSGMLLSQDDATCRAGLQDVSVKSELFPIPGQFKSLDRLCLFAAAKPSAAQGFKDRACRHGAPVSLCG